MKSLLLFVVLLTSSLLFSQEKQSLENPYPNFVPYADEQKTTEQNISDIDIKNLGKEQPARWLSVDPMADKYPGWSPYHYSLNNPLRYIDPNGMWSAERDENGNIIARYEDGDTYENLYNQLGMSAEQFASWTASQGIELSLDGSGMSFNITDFVVSNNNFDANFTGSNCHGFVTFAALNSGGAEQMVSQLNVNGLQATQNPTTGNIAVFNMEGQYQYKGQPTPVDASGIQGHSAVFVLNNQSGEAQYLNRINTGQPVTINTQSQIVSFFANPNNAYGGANAYIILPKLNSSPIFYRK